MDRRSFLGSLGALGAGAAAGALGVTTAACDDGDPGGPSALAPVAGLQLYTVREPLARDFDGTLAAVAGIGYRDVELAGLHGRSASEARAALDAAGLRATSAHVPLEALRDDTERTLDDAATLGHRWVVVPWIAEELRTADGYRALADTLSGAAEQAAGRGVRAAYHNHDFDLAPLGDETGLGILLDATAGSSVGFELDAYWAAVAGVDPVDYLDLHAGRFELLHLKDMRADGGMTDVGDGVLDFDRILDVAQRIDAHERFVEHDDPADPLASVRASLAYLNGRTST